MQARDNLGDYRVRQRSGKIPPSPIKPNHYEGLDFYQIDKKLKFEDLKLLIPDVPPARVDIVYTGPNEAEIEILQMDKKQLEEMEDRRLMYEAMKQPKNSGQGIKQRSNELFETLRNRPTSDPFCREDFYGLNKHPYPKQSPGSRKGAARLVRSPHGRKFDKVSPKASPRLPEHELMDLWTRFFTSTSSKWENDIREQLSAHEGRPEGPRLQQLLQDVMEIRRTAQAYIDHGMSVTKLRSMVLLAIKGLDQLITAFRKCDLSPGLLVEARELAAKFLRAM